MINRLYIFLFVFLLSVKMMAQSAASYKIINEENGLENYNVKSIVSDPLGFVWFATDFGLYRYDGQHVKGYSIQNNKDLIHTENRFPSLIRFKDKIAGDLPGNKRFIFERYIKIVNLKGRDSIGYKANFVNTKNGAYSNRGMWQELSVQMEQLKLELEKTKRLSAKVKSVLLENIVRKKYLLTPDKSIFLLDDQLNFYGFKNGNFYLEKPSISKLNYNNIQLFWDHNLGSCVLSADNQFYLIQLKNNRIDSLHFLLQLDEKIFTDLAFFDRERNQLFVSVPSEGVRVYNLVQTIKKFKLIDGHTEMAPFLYQNRFWICNEGVIKDKDGKIVNQIAEFKFSTCDIKLPDAMGNLMVSTYANGLLILDPNLKVKGLLDSSIRMERTLTAFFDHQNNLWVVYATKGTVVYKFSKGKYVPFHAHPNLKGNRRSVLVTKNKIILVLDSTMYFLTNGNIQSQISDYHVTNNRSLFYIDEKRFLITTYGNGVYLYDGLKVVHLPNDPNNYFNTAHFILEYKKGRILIVTNPGLIECSADFFMEWVKHGKVNGGFSYYNHKDGLVAKEFNGNGTPDYFAFDHSYAFATTTGILTMDSDIVFNNKFIGGILIDRIEVNGTTPTDFLNGETLKEYIKSIKIEASVAFVGRPEEFLLEVFVNGNLLKQYTNINDLKNLYISDLNYGDNQIEISVAFEKSVQKKKFQFYNPYPWYLNTWTVIGVIIALGLLFLLVAKLYNWYLIRRTVLLDQLVNKQSVILKNQIDDLENKNMELNKSISFKNNLIAIINHDIIGPLKFSNVVVKFLMGKEKDKENLDILGNLYESNLKLANASKEMLVWTMMENNSEKLSVKSINLLNMIEAKTDFYKSVYSLLDFKIQYQASANTIKVYSNEMLLSVILNNIIENAIKYSADNAIVFNIKEYSADNCVELTVSNLVKEFNEELIHQINSGYISNAQHFESMNGGYGLWIVLKLIKKIQAELKLDYVQSTVVFKLRIYNLSLT